MEKDNRDMNGHVNRGYQGDGYVSEKRANSQSNGFNGTTVKATEAEDAEPPVSRCKTCTLCCYSCCKPLMTKHNPLPPDPSRCEKLKYALLCPPHGNIAIVITLAFAVIFVWGVLWSITGNAALPGGNFFALLVLVVLCVIGGTIVEKMRLPPLLGMLIVGCLLRNVPVINVAKDIEKSWSSTLRSVALVVILTRAGLGLDPVKLRQLSAGVMRLAFMPCLCEALIATVTSHFIMGFPWIWGLMLGFVLAAVSPAVVVPCMLALNEAGYGVDKGIPTLIIAASSLDDVLSITGFGVSLGIAFSQGILALNIVKGFLEAVVGITYAVVFGIAIWYIPHKKHESTTLFRFIILFSAGLLAVFGSKALGISGAGALGALTISFVAAIKWRKEAGVGKQPPVVGIMAQLWKLFQPLLFGLIGAEINIEQIQAQTIGYGVAVLSVGLVIRMVVSFLATMGIGLNLKEKLFVPLAWLPKATVQAAIGSVALDTAREKNATPEEIDLGLQILTIAVLVILITAPLGSVAISLSAPKFLNRATPGSETNEKETEAYDNQGFNPHDMEQGSTKDLKESNQMTKF